MAVELERLAQRSQQDRIVVDQQDSESGGLYRGYLCGLRCARRGSRKGQAHGGSRARLTVDFELTAVALYHAIDHGESEACAALAFGREEGLETPPSGVFIHSNTGIDHFDEHPFGDVGPGAQCQRATVWHRVHRVEDQVREGFPDLALQAHDWRQPRGQLRADVDDNAALLRHRLPAGSREFLDLRHGLVEIDGARLCLYITLAIKFAHAGDGFRNVARRLLDRVQVAAAALAQTGFLFEHRVRIEHDRRDRIVDVVRNAARHLP